MHDFTTLHFPATVISSQFLSCCSRFQILMTILSLLATIKNLPPNKQLFRQSLYHSLLHRFSPWNPYKVKTIFFYLDHQRWINSFMWARNWIVEQEFSLDEFDRILESFFSCSMQSLTNTLKTFGCSPVAVNSFFFFHFSKMLLWSEIMFYFLWVSTPNSCIVASSLSQSIGRKAICFRENGYMELAERQSCLWVELEARFLCACKSL